MEDSGNHFDPKKVMSNKSIKSKSPSKSGQKAEGTSIDDYEDDEFDVQDESGSISNP